MFPISLVILASCLLAASLLFLLYVSNIHSQYKHIPGPKRQSFLLGNGPYLIKRFREDQTGFTVGLEYLRQYGAVFVLWYAIKPRVMVTDPETIKETIMSNIHLKQENRPEASLFGQRFLGRHSIFVNKGDDTWRSNRRAYNRHFGRSSMRECYELIETVTDRLTCKIWEMADSGAIVDLHHWIKLAACDIIGLVALDWDIQAIMESNSTFTDHLSVAMEGVAMSAGRPLSRISPQFVQARRQARTAVKELRKHCLGQVKSRLNRKVRGEETRPCVLDEILGQYTGDQEGQVDEMLAMFLAGQETVANVITFAICHAMRDRTILESIEQEVAHYNSNPSFEKLAGMTQIDNLMKETLRHYAPVPGLRRVLSSVTNISGYLVPRHTEIVHAHKLYAHDERIWGSDHDKFNPARFDHSTFSTSKEKGTPGLSRTPTKRINLHHDQNRHPHAFLPFGIGPRVCLGREMSKIEFKCIVAKLLRQFKFTPVQGEEVQAKRFNSVQPLSGYNCFVTRIN